MAPTATHLIERLHETLDGDARLARLLQRSLQRAHERAEADLDPALFAALEWPTTIEAYTDYITTFLRWIPQQSDATAWTDDDPQHRNSREVSDRLAHFFFLVDQHDGEDAGAAEGSAEFREWLTQVATEWGAFLDTPESFDDDILRTFVQDSPEYTVEESLVDGRPNEPSGWRTFNQFFARELNAGLRPIAEPGSNLLVTSPADCSYQHSYDIDDESNIPAVRVKNIKTYGNIRTLLEGSEYADAFAGGTFVHYMLPPSAYHRFHVPVAGAVREARVVQGQVYMQVDLRDGQLASLDRTETGYEFFQTRGVVVVDTAGSPGGDVGLVGVVPVGMAHVASVVLTAQAGAEVAKGEEFGYFQFGGSDIVLLFQAGTQPQVDTSADFRHVGTPAVRLTGRRS
ncbi:Phosphatidylserine decarboxylase [Jatrophihabitans endophyticus]|uniref:Phosphatidylserine decarboxylase n=1 Tax=Jatrophihabitans endophyticus TaxID=1206085 RepID=A0A1M5E418_9ACTN|nr:phosphatidylserine decarboxylase [Jatrophihabitans endophyticus]SHF73999.1 Phosphatidylserine decarboxylase [Jatrophihabitans endophyticus]